LEFIFQVLTINIKTCKGKAMSWFKRSPRRNEPQKTHVYHPPQTTPASERMLEEAKAIGPFKKNKKVKPL
jgi:hypothetical protein